MKKNILNDYNDLLKIAMAYRSSKPILVALHYDLFTWIDRGYRTARALSRRLDLNARALQILLDAIASLGLLRKEATRYANTTAAKRLLVSTSPNYQGHNLRYQELTWDAWSDLRAVLKTGRPRLSLVEWIHKRVFTDDYVRAMGDVARSPARELAGKLDLSAVRRSLDVGCGPGAYSAALADRSEQLQATLLDLPRTLRLTKRLLRGHHRERNFRFLPADFLRDDFGDNEYDLVLISNVAHCEDIKNNRLLVRKAHRALRAGGRLVLHDYAASPDRTSPPFAALLAVHLLVFTGRGNVYTLDEYIDWMRRQGFRRISHVGVAAGSLHPSTAIIGHKV